VHITSGGGDSRAAQVPNASPSRIRADGWGPLVSRSLCCSLALSGWWYPGGQTFPPHRITTDPESGHARWMSAKLGCGRFLSRWSRQESRVRTSLAGRYKNMSRQGWETEEETEGEREWGAAAKQVMSSAPSAVQGSWRPCLSNWGRVGLPVGASDLPSPEAETGTAQFLAGHRPWRIRRAISSWRPSTPQSPVRTSFTCPLSSTLGVEPVSLESAGARRGCSHQGGSAALFVARWKKGHRPLINL
jgi:hypothetical protein